MADMAMNIIISPFLGVLFDNLSSLIHKEVGLMWGVNNQMEKLSNTLSTIRDVLEDAEEKQMTNKAIVNWLRKLEDVAYEADDVLDDWATEVKLMQQGSKKVSDSFLLLSCFDFDHIKFRRKIAKKINYFIERFDELAFEKSKFHVSEGFKEKKVEVYQNPETSSIGSELEIYGRDEEKEYIVGLLLNNVNNQNVVSICPIIGIGGLGKTTVAQFVYNDKRVEEHFEVRVWVCVSNNFDVKKLTRAVVDSVSGNASSLEELDPLQRCLQGKLAGKRFLLVLDDIWNENQEEWDRFKYPLRCGAKGSSIIVTTRLETVASITGTCCPYSLKFLSEDDCWSLFRQRAFGIGNIESPNLVKIGKEILKKCGGVPLAAKVLGGLMRFKIDEKEWLFVRDSRIWDLPESDENTILPALRLSYSHLSPNLRRCFAYCSIFPKDHRIQKEEVIHLWMANGLFQSKERIQLEDIGNEIYNALLLRSFFQDVEKDEDGNVESFLMHDLVHDLACSITNQFSSAVGGHMKILPKGARHVSVTSDSAHSPFIVQSINQPMPNLRTFISLTRWGSEFPTHLNFSAFKSLRAMSLASTNISSLPDSIGNLKHLRYLNLSNTRIVLLPESICGLANLLTFKLESCLYLQSLPKFMNKMRSLRHLDIRGCYTLVQMPIEMGKLTCLQTLSIFIAGSGDGHGVKELQGMDHLGGELEIKGLENVRSFKDAKDANLMGKQNLRTFSLTWGDSHKEEESDRDVIEGFQPHPNVKRLFITRYQGRTFPSWFQFSTLPNIVEILLKRCSRSEHLPSLGRLPLLKYLDMSGMQHVKYFSNGDMVNCFPSLEELYLSDMPALEEWFSYMSDSGGQNDVIMFPSLKHLRIRRCRKMKRLPLSSFLESLDVEDCDEMLLRSLKDLPRLSSLKVNCFTEVICFPEGMLQSLPALQYLSILNCTKLKALPAELGFLSELISLKIISCTDLSCSGLTNLSHGYQTTLQSIHISSCENLTNLPDGLQHLTNLQLLWISNCHPALHKRFEKETGEDWHKIAHIPDLRVSGKTYSLIILLTFFSFAFAPNFDFPFLHTVLE
ncbi:hypothetical protein AQUCO_04500127v1 [Aquilegia coerulea]|uniref:Disease resistance protein RGA3 n=1 Tax=Aquilegia coerulea TaxID=218851 RepID=A0A2G5CN76_AQUCA|nr:hypothetical protein AQUCO_04500127v1 [Aquilegia coerulea]